MLLTTQFVKAQSDADALRFSQTTLGGTARSASVANAVGALGGDFNAISVNPAGAAIYRSSEFVITPTIHSGLSSSKYLGFNNTDGKYTFNFNTVGFVFTMFYKDYVEGKRETRTKGWVNSNLAIGFNRLNNYNNSIYFAGINKNNSLIDNYIESVNANDGTPISDLEKSFPFTADLAYQTFLIDPTDSIGSKYVRAFPIGSDGLIQRKTITTSGALDEYYVALAGNYSNRMYLGCSFNFPTIHYTETSSFGEEAVTIDTTTYFKDYQIDEDITTTGRGFNFKMGMIFRITDFMRIGGSVQSPTYFDMTDKWSSRMISGIHQKSYEYSSPDGRFDYSLSTPFKATASLAFIIGKFGFLSTDYEIVDYSTARFRSGSYRFFDENNAIATKYRSIANIRVGTEWKFQNFLFRGGYAMYDTPFHSNYKPSNGSQARTSYTLGFGIREAEYFMDFAYVYTTSNSFYKPYSLADQTTDGADIKTTTNNFLVTVGFKF